MRRQERNHPVGVLWDVDEVLGCYLFEPLLRPIRLVLIEIEDRQTKLAKTLWIVSIPLK